MRRWTVIDGGIGERVCDAYNGIYDGMAGRQNDGEVGKKVVRLQCFRNQIVDAHMSKCQSHLDAEKGHASQS